MKKITQIGLLGTTAVLVAGVGTSYAASGAAAPPPVIHACKAKRDGNVRIVGKKTRCKRNETRTTWNQRGVKGDRGPAGPSNGYTAFGADTMDIPASTGPQDNRNVVSLQLPAGSYVITAVVSFQYAVYVECGLSGAKRTAVTPVENSASLDKYATLTVTAGITLGQPGQAAIECHSPQKASIARRPILTAVKVGTLGTTGTPYKGAGNGSLRR